LKKGFEGERRPKGRVIVQKKINTYIYTDFKNLFDKYLHWLCISVKNIYTHINHVSVNVKSSDINVNDLHLHGIYTLYIWLLRVTGTTLRQTL